ncbi:MAG: DMT family transporter, partial [Lachnospiraceae bacterium]|nr:DMT family transporter [Lachnospiraceae bacterium]
MKEKKNSIGYELLLILVTIFWGTTFVAQSTAMDRIGPFTFVAVRFAITSVVLMGVSALWLKIRRVRCCRIQKCGNGNLQAKAAIKQNALDIQIDWKRTIKGGLICGVALFTGAVFQQIGL